MVLLIRLDRDVFTASRASDCHQTREIINSSKGNAELALQIDAYLPAEYISDERPKNRNI